MILLFVVLLSLTCLVVWLRKRKAARALLAAPLAGRDTGVRSAYNVPAGGRFIRNRRTL